jgi:hypothetical protein
MDDCVSNASAVKQRHRKTACFQMSYYDQVRNCYRARRVLPMMPILQRSAVKFNATQRSGTIAIKQATLAGLTGQGFGCSGVAANFLESFA